jgi:hypothetical protein
MTGARQSDWFDCPVGFKACAVRGARLMDINDGVNTARLITPPPTRCHQRIPTDVEHRSPHTV